MSEAGGKLISTAFFIILFLGGLVLCSGAASEPDYERELRYEDAELSEW